MHLAGIIAAMSLALFLAYSHPEYFRDITVLGGMLVLEIIIAGLWNYDERFFVLLIVTFIWAGTHVPLQSAGSVGRWVVLAAGALVGSIIWIRDPRRPFGAINLVALFCVFMAFVSATVSQFVQTASLKALSLGLLFLYCSTGARLAVLGREEKFFRGLVWGCEALAYATALCYAAGYPIWGNPNSLGAVLSIGVFPVLLWAWLNSDGPLTKIRRMACLILCAYLARYSLSRAAMITVAMVTIVFFVSLRRYKALVQISVAILFLISVGGMLAPDKLSKQVYDFKDEFLYKGHKEEGVMGSRRGPWEASIASIKAHPLFGTGYGTSPTGVDPGLSVGMTSSTAETAREHGSSYISITEWVGLFGGLPFVGLLLLTLLNLWKICRLMLQTRDPRYYSIPLAMVVLAGFVHGVFEDWIFAVGSYLSLFFWICAFLLPDFMQAAESVPAIGHVPYAAVPLPSDYGAIVSSR
jgi:O-antigen ligase